MLIFVPLAAVDYGTEDDVRAIGEELPFGHWITRTGGCQAERPEPYGRRGRLVLVAISQFLQHRRIWWFHVILVPAPLVH